MPMLELHSDSVVPARFGTLKQMQETQCNSPTILCVQIEDVTMPYNTWRATLLEPLNGDRLPAVSFREFARVIRDRLQPGKAYWITGFDVLPLKFCHRGFAGKSRWEIRLMDTTRTRCIGPVELPRHPSLAGPTDLRVARLDCSSHLSRCDVIGVVHDVGPIHGDPMSACCCRILSLVDYGYARVHLCLRGEFAREECDWIGKVLCARQLVISCNPNEPVRLVTTRDTVLHLNPFGVQSALLLGWYNDRTNRRKFHQMVASPGRVPIQNIQ